MPHVPWREAWNEALYGPGGFFVSERPAQHFRTAVTASDVFAGAIARLAREEGLTEPFVLVRLLVVADRRR